MDYSTLGDILADRGLGLGEVEPTADAILRAIENRLRARQVDTVLSTPEDYNRLIAAREAIKRLIGNNRKSYELATIPGAFVERVLDIIQGAGRESVSTRPSVEEQMRAKRSITATKASRDFRNLRALPLAGIGIITAALWGARQAFDVGQSILGTVIWMLGSGLVIVTSFLILLLARFVQSGDEATLLRLFDPDVQAIALKAAGQIVGRRRSFTRSQFRESLLRVADEKVPDPWPLLFPKLVGNKEIGTTKDPAVSDSAQNTLGTSADKESQSSDTEPPENYLPEVRQLLRTAQILSTIDIPSALEDAADLSIARYIEMGILEIQQAVGSTTFIIKQAHSEESAGPDISGGLAEQDRAGVLDQSGSFCGDLQGMVPPVIRP